MSKLFSTTLLIALFALTSSKEAWQCDTAIVYSCTTSQSCCRSAVYTSGWACYNSVNAVCCSDGNSACPAGYICNLNEKRCDPNSAHK